MHTVELLQEAVDTARRLGYEVRQDWLGGNGGGHCLVRGRKWLLLDVAQIGRRATRRRCRALRGEAGASKAVQSPRACRTARRSQRGVRRVEGDSVQ